MKCYNSDIMTVNAIIVDDEYRIGQLISKLIHCEELGIELLSVFNSSTDACNFILRNNPDIVISDIQMPVMDGLELIRTVKEAGGNSYFILISGFREFEYARTALKYGVEDYLLKPIKEEELNRVLSEVVQKLNHEVQQREETERLQKDVKRAHALSGADVISVFGSGSVNRTIEEINASFQVHFRNGMFLPLVIKIDYDKPEEGENLQDRFVMNSVVSMMEEAYRDLVYEQLYSVIERCRITGILNYAESDSAQLKEQIRNQFVNIRSHTEVVPGYHVTMALGDPCAFADIPESLRTAESRVVQRILIGTGKVISDTPVNTAAGRNERMSPAYEQRIQNAAVSFQQTELNTVIDELFKEAAHWPVEEADRIRARAGNVIGCFFRAFSLSQSEREEQQRIRTAAGSCYTIEMLVKTLKKELGEFLRERSRSLQAQTRRPVREAIEYINKNYGEKITLDSICEQLQMNPSYFSTLFKKETGENFQNYLTSFRIEKAKELLRTTDDTMQAIAGKVGYTDTRYFSQSFTKIVGIKPSLYRKMYS